MNRFRGLLIRWEKRVQGKLFETRSCNICCADCDHTGLCILFKFVLPQQPIFVNQIRFISLFSENSKSGPNTGWMLWDDSIIQSVGIDNDS